ncbi:MAG TPA: AMP-binding protein [Blastocatellia bacterium]|nr:AMP-binding protein [Blastocatellia bacterium]
MARVGGLVARDAASYLTHRGRHKRVRKIVAIGITAAETSPLAGELGAAYDKSDSSAAGRPMRTNLLSFLDDCESHGSQTALARRRGLRVERWSYSSLRVTAVGVAGELAARGISKGDRVLFWAENSPEWVAGFFGCLLRGAIVVPLDYESSPDFVARVQQQVEAKLIFFSGDRLRDSTLNIPRLSLDELSDNLAIRSNESFVQEEILDGDIAEIIFTSGTTAEPKGVCLTHKNILANINPLETEIQKYLKYERLVHPLRFLNLVPLSHVFGQFMGIFVPQLLAGEIFFQDSLNPSQIIDTVRKHRISVIVAVPRVLETLRNKIERDFESRGESDVLDRKLASAESQHFLRRWCTFRRVHRQFGWKFWAFVSGGAALPAETEAFWRRLGYAVVQGYGMTETASLITVNHPFNLSRRSIGKVMPGQQVKLGEGGEILVRGDNVSSGYWKAGPPSLTNEEGWLRTGDVAEIDESGNLFFKSRKKDVIVTAAGLNIYPDDLEAALNAQPEIRDSAVISIDTAQGPEPLAVLLLKDEHADAALVVKKANESLNQYQQIRRWSIWPEEDFPRTSTQKIRKPLVLEKVRQRSEVRDQRSVDWNAKPAPSSFIVSAIARVSGESLAEVDPAANLEMDLKLDSLGRIELLSALEDHYQVDIDEAAFTAATTVGDIEKMIREGPRESAVPYEYPKWPQRFPVTWIRLAMFYLVIRPLTQWMGRVTIVGREHLRNVRGPVLFISNHIAMVDAALILLAVPARFHRRLAIAMEGEVLRGWRHPPSRTSWFNRFIGLSKYLLVVGLFNVFPLPQKSGFRRSFDFAGESMDRGYSVLVFPEGARTQDGEMKPFMEGIGLMARNLNVPVVPARIEGLFELKKRRQKFARRGEVRVILGEPISLSSDDPAAITQQLFERVANL